MESSQTAILNQLASSHSDNMAYSRFFNNDSVGVDSLIESSQRKVKDISQGKHLLCLQDTSEINYEKHRDFFHVEDKDLGPVGNNKDIGFFLHPMLVVDSNVYFPLGFSYIHLWNRNFNKQDKHKRNYRNQPIEEKESYRWITTGQESIKLLKDSVAHMTIIGDRESDIYQEFTLLKGSKTDLLVRSKENRKLYGEDMQLYEYLSGQDVSGSDKRKNRESREAVIEVKYCKVKVSRPVTHPDKGLPEYIELTAIEARESESSVPAGEKPILWRLLTTHQVTDISTAMLMVMWYKTRWLIEELFRLLKQQGIDIESSQLESGKGLKKLAIMAMQAALKILQLRQDRDGLCSIGGYIAFSQEEMDFAETIYHAQYKGKTTLQRNPHPLNSLARMSWTIARMGGWKGYQSTGKPGPISYKKGLDKFNLMHQGLILSKLYKDVYKE